MIECGGVYLPDGETHLVEWMEKRNERTAGKLTYQRHKQLAALRLTSARGCMVDVGAHCGLWAMWMGQEFATVLAFEPMPEHVDCLRRNCAGLDSIQVYEFALGEKRGRTTMRTDPSSSGDTYPDPAAQDGQTVVMRFDDLTVGKRVDLVKLDCEGYELFALRGMREMLERDHPAVVVEQKRNRATKFGIGERDAVTFLEGLGATLVKEMAGDFFLRWE